MAFSQSVKKGQIPVYCNLCETETKITCKCIECNLLMCTNCKNRIHPKIAKNHRVVDIKDIKDHIAEITAKELDFTNIKCQVHSGQNSCLFCKSCHQLVCPLCISEVHNGHSLVQIKEGYEIQMGKLEPLEIQVSKNLDEVRDNEQKIENIKKTENTKYHDVKKRILEQNTVLKEAVDQYTNDLLKILDQNWGGLEKAISKEQKNITKLKKDLTEKSTHLKNLRELRQVEKIFSGTKNLTETITSGPKSMELTFDSMPTFTPGEISQYNFGQLHQSPSTAIDINILQSFTTKLGIVSHISVNPDDSLWINNGIQKLLQKVKPEGDNLRTISSHDILVFGMALTPSNDILLVTGKSTLQMISNDSGEVKDTKFTLPSLACVAIHVTGDNKVIIGAKDEGPAFPVSGKRVVILMDMEGKHEITFEHDQNGEKLFSYPKQITSTRNKNIFVINRLSEDKGRVVILQHTRDVVNIYRGHPDINDDKRMFCPVDMACTASDNVIVTDLDTNIIHILNNTGYLIKYYKVSDIGIVYPLSVDFSISGKFYIGCNRPAGSKENNAKLYELNISGI